MCSSSMRAHTGAFGFKRAAPFSYVDKTGWCYLLQNAGACKIADFGVELFTRLCHIQTASTHLRTSLNCNLTYLQANRVGAPVQRNCTRIRQCVNIH